jgi:trimethylamine--corrinoid protein Co-methyltransferase
MKLCRKQPSVLKVITDEEVEQIHRTSLRILWEIGVKFPNEQMLAKFETAGAKVDYDKQVVKIPEDLVNQALATLPKDFSITPADGGPPITLGDGDLKLSMDTCPDIVDVMTNTKRRGTAEDVLKGIAVSNALENVRLASGYCLPSEIVQYAGDVYLHELLWTYSKKPIATWIYSSRSADYILEMAKLVAGGEEELRRKKLLTFFAEAISPLHYAPHTLEIVLKLTQYELPIYLGPMVTMGGSGPVTMAGALALNNAEILHGLVMIYLCNPKQPVIYGCDCHSMDLSRMVTQYGAPEQALLAVGGTQLAKRHGLAVCGNVLLTDSNLLDYMAGFEEGATVAYALAAGWDMLGFMGYGTIGAVGNGVGHSLEKVIVQDDALSYLKRMLRSFEINEETLAFEVIKDVGIGGYFMATDHTVSHMRSEVWQSKGIFKNYDYAEWSQAGAESITDRAHARLNQILDSSLPLEPVVPEKTVQALRELTKAAKEEVRQ